MISVSECDPETGTYSAQIEVFFANAAANSQLHIEANETAYDFVISGNSMVVDLVGLPVLSGNGAPVNLYVEVTGFDTPCDDFYKEVWFAPGVEDCMNQVTLGNEPVQQYRFYPNPVISQLSIEFNYVQITLVDLSGKTLKIWTTQQSVLDLTTVPSGVYHLLIQTKEGQISKKLIKK